MLLEMNDLNLMIRFRLTGQDEFQMKGASRMKMDGRGGLILYDAQSGKAERIEIGQLQSFILQPANCSTSARPN